MVELKWEYDLCDIWRIRNPLEKEFTIRQSHSSSIINCRLDYIFISKKLQEFSNKAIKLPALKTDHSSVSAIISNYNEIKPGPDIRKLEKLKNFTENVKEELHSENSFDDNRKITNRK